MLFFHWKFSFLRQRHEAQHIRDETNCAIMDSKACPFLCPHYSTTSLLLSKIKATIFKRGQLSAFKRICMDISFQPFNSFLTANFLARIKHSIPTFSSLQSFQILNSVPPIPTSTSYIFFFYWYFPISHRGTTQKSR